VCLLGFIHCISAIPHSLNRGGNLIGALPFKCSQPKFVKVRWPHMVAHFRITRLAIGRWQVGIFVD
jgi:hypothetical protein